MSSVYIHPKALVEKGARIGPGTRIWAFAHVKSGAVIGPRCNIGDYSYVENGVTLGEGVTVKNGVQLWEGVQAEEDVFVGPGCVFTNHLTPRAFLKIPKTQWLRRTILKKGCTLGASATILAGTTIGAYAFVAAGGLVTANVPPFALVMGQPARFHSWRCLCARALRFAAGRARCSACGSSFRMGRTQRSVELVERGGKFKHA